jgi:hypothetical protein
MSSLRVSIRRFFTGSKCRPRRLIISESRLSKAREALSRSCMQQRTEHACCNTVRTMKTNPNATSSSSFDASFDAPPWRVDVQVNADEFLGKRAGKTASATEPSSKCGYVGRPTKERFRAPGQVLLYPRSRRLTTWSLSRERSSRILQRPSNERTRLQQR